MCPGGRRAAAVGSRGRPPSPRGRSLPPPAVSPSQAAADALDARLLSDGRLVAGGAAGDGATVHRLVWGAHPTTGDRVDVVRLATPNGAAAAVTTVGGRLLYLVEPGGGGANVTLTPPSLAAVAADGHYLGAIVGRTANRVRGAVVSVGDVDHPLDANDGGHSLHGGRVGWSRRLWTVAPADVGVGGAGARARAAVTLRLVSGDGEGGHPGGLSVAVTYTLGPGGRLRIDAAAVNDGRSGAALVNVTHHAYWVLHAGAPGGHPVSVVRDVALTSSAARMVETDAACAATGALVPPPAGLDLTGGGRSACPPTVFWSCPRRRRPTAAAVTAAAVTAAAAAAAAGGGGGGGGGGSGGAHGAPGHTGGVACAGADAAAPPLRLAADLVSAATGRRLRVYTDQPGFQLYTANGFTAAADGFDAHGAVCVEASAVLGTEERTCVVGEGETRVQTTVYEVVPPGGGGGERRHSGGDTARPGRRRRRLHTLAQRRFRLRARNVRRRRTCTAGKRRSSRRRGTRVQQEPKKKYSHPTAMRAPRS
ncbi:hypothetical protein BU14_0577s0007 [Porphyra umbilicalis]|uniref:Aldose 1-epimerase n=1 Tax=Porphyra umbilicalis TaxID=2786 RepID=A0A1X6NRJ8_PORUM|nr:hypothetical protein BU14_0577s0007 [Porphyra umbilicalis]|eukprot:OSX71207.1 hypothetical protein BU14_0577s0007 [Porphyra umbilicalis]